MKTNSMHNFRMINIIGIDGAGKTTLARSVAKELHKTDNNIHYRYCQYFAKLLYPVKLLAKFSVMRRTDEFRNYETYNNTKTSFSRRFPRLAGIYTFIWLFDYLIQVLFKITIPVFTGRRLIIDRYIFDIAVNLSLTTGRDVEYAAKLVNRFCRFGLRPDLIIYIDLPEDVAFKRKDDIPDLEYLRERRERYLWLAKRYGFEIVDGNNRPERVFKNVMAVL